MKIAHYGLILTVVVLSGLLVLIWPKVPERDAESSESAFRQNTRHSVDQPEDDSTKPRPRRIAEDQEPKPWKADPDVIERFAVEDKNSDLAMFYESQGFTNYFELMRKSFRGDQESLAMIFNSPLTDGSASESFSIHMKLLLGQLGDRYFAHQLYQQPPEVQRRIIKSIWRNEFESIVAGHVPTIDNQLCPAVGQLATKLEAEKDAP